MIYDIAIIGAGPAGLTAALYAARRKLNIVVITKDMGGQAALAGNVENYPGLESAPGLELIKKFTEQIKKYSLEIKTGALVEKIGKDENGFSVGLINGEKIEAKTVIVAAGQTPRRLKIPGEKELEKKGVAYCATCDGPLFANKNVAVVGGGNSAMDSILQLDKYANKVYAININPDFSGEKTRAEKIRQSAKIEVLTQTEIKEIVGKDFVEGVVVENIKNKEKKTLAVSGVFIEIGYLPASGFLANILKLNDKGEIIVDKKNQTSIQGIFAAGDITDVPYKQIIIAAGEGAKAALSAAGYLSTQKTI